VRTGGDADLPRVLEILKSAFALHDGRIDPMSGAHRETLDALAGRLAEETLLVAESAGEVSGCIWCHAKGNDLYIGRLAVDPSVHRRGIARELLLASIALARDLGAATMSLGVRVELHENVAFFERYGFRITLADAHPGYDRPTNYHMELDLGAAVAG
jgi:ribosomal protein S18 acetylase RimI-like enzyme